MAGDAIKDGAIWVPRGLEKTPFGVDDLLTVPRALFDPKQIQVEKRQDDVDEAK